MTQLTIVLLAETGIDDILPLAARTELSSAFLDDNAIQVVTALLDLPRLSRVIVTRNPLSQQALCIDIPALQAQGVQVHHDGTCANGG